ncbi:MAG: prepilin-type N-terminal cleavage/methylation domain-containing protein [Armatimonadia bacterium]
MTKAQRPSKGFTLIELLVVISIMAVLLAIIVPIGKRLRESNNTNRCEAQLAHLGQALKMYFLDEGGVPPVAVEGHFTGAEASRFDLPTECTSQPVVDDATVTHNAAVEEFWPGLQTLFYLDYLKDRKVLHCPRNTEDSTGATLTSGSSEFYQSYTKMDENAKFGDNEARKYKYFPCRFALSADYPDDYRRQLTRTLIQTSDGYLVTGASSSIPPDDTIVTWCEYHASTYSINGHGQYVVLFWDGSVRLLDKELFTDDGVGPDEAWMVRPSDSAD